MRLALILSTFLLKIIICSVADDNLQLTPYQLNPLVKFMNRYDDLSEYVNFFLFTRSNPDVGQQLWIDDVATLEASNFNASLATKLITHGWMSNCNNSIVCVGVRQGFLSHDNYNVISVDWSRISKKGYLEAAIDVRAVGRYVARMVNFLRSRGSNPKTMTLAGHSLGAHIVGLAGKNLTTKVGHIVGLDPAGPGFEVQSPNGRISSLSGDYVEIIHTDAGVLGMIRAIGHQDYYPNGGAVQPGCGADPATVCAHGRSYVYYAESLRRPDYWLGVLCEHYSLFLQGRCDENARAAFPRWAPVPDKPKGSYILRTLPTDPYGLGYDGTRPRYLVEEEAAANNLKILR